METDEIILTDISEEDELVTPELTGRDAIMQGIISGRDKEIRELEEGLVEKDDVELEQVEKIVEDEFVTVKVNGKTYEVEADKIKKAGGVEAYQRNAAAHEKQREVANREAAIKKREQELAEIERKLLNPDPVVEEDNGEVGKDFAEKIFDDPDAVAETINSLESRTRKAEKTATEALERLNRKDLDDQQKANEEVVQYFWKNHKEIAGNQRLTDALNARLGLVSQENPGFTQQQIIDAAAKQVYFSFPDIQKKSEKETQDRTPVKAPSRATSRKPPTPEVKTKTPEEIVRDLAMARTPLRH